MLWNEEGIGVIAINNGPENALSLDVIMQLTTALTVANNDNGINWVVITGTGGSFFTVGIPWDSITPDYASIKELVRGIKALVSVIAVMDKPVITILNGSAMGLGMELALVSDLVIAPPDVYMCYPEGIVGIPMPLGAKVILERMPRYKAIDVLTGSPLAITEAANYGIVHIINRENLFGDAKNIIKGLRLQPPIRHQLVDWVKAGINAIDSLYLDAVVSTLMDQGRRNELLKAVKNARLKCVSKYKGT